MMELEVYFILNLGFASLMKKLFVLNLYGNLPSKGGPAGLLRLRTDAASRVVEMIL